jgi:hypothetical protein
LDSNCFERKWFERKIAVAGQGEFAAASLLSCSLGDFRKMSAARQGKTLALAALFCAGLALAGCSSQIADLPLVGTPADAPARPKEPGAYLPVNDLPPDRDQATMDAKERAKIQAELIAARDRQAVVGQGIATQGREAGAAAK